MARVGVSVKRNRSGPTARLVIRTSNRSIVYSAPFAPREVDYSGYEAVYQEVERPGRKPLLRRSAESLRRISMEIFVGSDKIEQTVNGDLVTLENLAKSKLPLVIEYEPRTYGQWHIEALSYSSVDRVEASDGISRALVTIDFVEIPLGAKATTTPTPNPDKDRPRVWTVSKGETLLGIVLKVYGFPTDFVRLRRIAKLNNIKRTNRPLKPGRKIRLV